MSNDLDLALRIIGAVIGLVMAVYLGWVLRVQFDQRLRAARQQGINDALAHLARFYPRGRD